LFGVDALGELVAILLTKAAEALKMRFAPLVVGLVWTALLGCSSAPTTGGEQVQSGPDSGADGGGGDDSDAAPNSGWAGQTNIEDIFQNNCARCHGEVFGSCWGLQGSASQIEQAVASGAMPRNGMLADSEKTALLAWLNAGAQCTGDPVDAGGAFLSFGGDTPVAVGQ
jgi:hypothetical protein